MQVVYVIFLSLPTSCSRRCSRLIAAPLSRPRPSSSVCLCCYATLPSSPPPAFPCKIRPSRDHGEAAGVPTPTGPPPSPSRLPQLPTPFASSPTPIPPILAPWGSCEGKATQRSVHLPEGHSDSSILCPAPVMLPPQKGTLYETWQDLSTGQEELAPWFFYFLCFDPEGREGREEGYQSPANPPNTTLKLRTKPSDLSGQPHRTSFCNINSCTAFVPETSTSTFLVKVVSGSLGNYWC